ncbi:MAG TPA: HAD-IA family hydrolase [Longimicrobiales bacterium]|nr:HAD-IA family hydrolase [Longimicrobiales bacterium]
METTAGFECGALLFDLDGVLVDSVECVERTWHRWAEANGLDPTDVIESAHGRRTIETVQVVAPHLAAEAEVARLAASESNETDGVYEVPGARELLKGLPVQSWAVVTSGIRAVAELRIRHTRLPVPSVLVCADDINVGKPDPEAYLTAAARLGVEPERCVVVEDAPPGIEAARAAGMRAIGVLGTYGREALARGHCIIPGVRWMEVEASRSGLRVRLRQPPA